MLSRHGPITFSCLRRREKSAHKGAIFTTKKADLDLNLSERRELCLLARSGGFAKNNQKVWWILKNLTPNPFP